MTALLNAAHHALTHTAPIPEAAMFAAPWVVLLAAVGIYRAAAAAWWAIHGGYARPRCACPSCSADFEHYDVAEQAQDNVLATCSRPVLGALHPTRTYNVGLDMTWCLCGTEITSGDTAVPHVACCGGPLIQLTEPTPLFESRAT